SDDDGTIPDTTSDTISGPVTRRTFIKSASVAAGALAAAQASITGGGGGGGAARAAASQHHGSVGGGQRRDPHRPDRRRRPRHRRGAERDQGREGRPAGGDGRALPGSAPARAPRHHRTLPGD